MTKLLPVMALLSMMIACSNPKTNKTVPADNATAEKQVGALLDSLNAAAAHADFDNYFKLYAGDAIFTGTDATERWNKQQFMDYAKPYFDKGKAWSFTTMDRHIYFDSTGTIAWFDELLNTQMKICRGSGVAAKTGDDWKLKQYILSTTIPNEVMDTILPFKVPIEDSIIHQFSNR